MMRAYQEQYSYSDNFTDGYQNNGWNYSLFGYNDYNDQSKNYWGQYGYNYEPQYGHHQRSGSFCDNTSAPISNSKNKQQCLNSKDGKASMLKAKKSGRVFYPTKVHHSRHNSHDNDAIKNQRENLSPLNLSRDSTCDSSSAITDSSSKDGSGAKLKMAKVASERVKEIIPIKLNFDDESSPVLPSLIVEVISSTNNIEYELEQNDVRKVFEKFGPVSSVTVHEKSNKAVVIMEDPKNGYQAEKYLNFYQLPGTTAYLTVKWQFGDYECLQRAAMFQKSSTLKSAELSNPSQINRNNHNEDAQKSQSKNEENGSLSTTSASYQCQSEFSQGEGSPKTGVSRECTSVSKFTCKYEVVIKNIPGFSAARKIIGHRGKNMKNILDRLKDNHFEGPIQDVIKLRLRGQGSGFKEGPNNCESPEPLHLCVSSKYYEKYTEACKLVEKLLRDVYQEYNNYCRWKGRPVKHHKISKMENSPASYLSNYSSKAQQ